MRNASPSPSSRRMRFATSYPSISGMVMSRSTTSGRSTLARSRACGPSCAVATSCPQSRSSSPKASAASTSSSTTRTRRRGPLAPTDVTSSILRDACHASDRVEPLGTIATERGAYLGRDVLFSHDLGTHGVIDVVMQVGDLVGIPHDPSLGRLGNAPRGGLDPTFGGRAVLSYPVANFLREVQPGAVLLDLLDDADALLVMPEAVGQEL